MQPSAEAAQLTHQSQQPVTEEAGEQSHLVLAEKAAWMPSLLQSSSDTADANV